MCGNYEEDICAKFIDSERERLKIPNFIIDECVHAVKDVLYKHGYSLFDVKVDYCYITLEILKEGCIPPYEGPIPPLEYIDCMKTYTEKHKVDKEIPEEEKQDSLLMTMNEAYKDWLIMCSV